MYNFRISLISLGILFSVQTYAVDSIWNGSTNADFNNPVNWSAGVPGTGNVATLNPDTPIDIAAGGPGGFLLGSFDVNAPDFVFTNNAPGAGFTFDGAGITGPETLGITNNTIMTFGTGTNAGLTDFGNNLGGRLIFTGNSQAQNALIINGNADIEIDNRAGSTFNLGALSGAGRVSATNGPAELSIGGLNLSDTFSGNFLGAGPDALSVTKVGTGTLTLTSTGHNYTGPTNINEGTVVFNGGFVGGSSLFTIAEGATLRGNPVGVHAGSINNNGKLFPGTTDSPTEFGFFHTSMDYNSPNGTGEICFNISPTSATQLQFDGTVTLTGSTGRIVNTAPGRYQVTHPLIFAGAPPVGTLSGPVGLPPLINGVFRNDGNDVVLGLTEKPLIDVIRSCPDTNEDDEDVARAISLFRSGLLKANDDFSEKLGFLNIAPTKEAVLFLMKVLQSVTPAISIIANEEIDRTNSAVTNYFALASLILPSNGQSFTAKPFTPILRDNVAGYHFAKAANAYNCPLQKTRAHCDSNFTETALTLQNTLGSHQRDHGRKAIAHNPRHGHLWFQGFGSKFDHDRTFKTLGFRGNQAGVMMGFDYQVNDDLLLGVGGGYKHTNLDVNLDVAHQKTETPFGSIWGLYSLGNYDLEGGLTYNRKSHEAKRYIRGLGNTLTAKHKNHGYSLLPHFAVAYNHWAECDVHVRPFVAFDFLYLNENGYTETGANSLNLTVKDHTTSSLQSSLGFMIDRHIKWCEGDFRPSFEARYMNRTQLRKAKIVNAFSFAPQATFISTANQKSLHRLGLAAEIAYEWHDGANFRLRYSGDYGKNQKSHTGLISIGKKW